MKDAPRGQRVFMAEGRMMALMVNGDLYALGRNINAALGAEIPRYWDRPMCIAQDVKDAAMSRYHTMYITKQGCAVLMGKAEIVKRIACDLCVQRVYADTEAECRFWIVNEAGEVYLLGERTEDNLRETLLEEAPETAIQYVRIMDGATDGVSRNAALIRYWSEWENTETAERRIADAVSPEPDTDKLVFDSSRTAAQEHVRQTERYRELAAEHGAENLRIEPGEPESSVLVAQQKGNGILRKAWRVVYRPKILLKNRWVYAPERICGRGFVQARIFCNGRPIEGGWKQNGSITKGCMYKNELRMYMDDRGLLHCCEADGTNVVAPTEVLKDFDAWFSSERSCWLITCGRDGSIRWGFVDDLYDKQCYERLSRFFDE